VVVFLYIPVEMALNNNSLSLRSFLEKEKLEENGINYVDWIRTLRIVLRQEEKLYVLTEPIPEEPAVNAAKALKDQYTKHSKDARDIGCLMLMTMCKNLQKGLEHLVVIDMYVVLNEMFQVQARQERYETVKALHSCKMNEGEAVGPHAQKMKGHVEHLERLGFPVSQELATDLILNSLPESYSNFIMQFNLNGMDKTLSELIQLLTNAEKSIGKKTGHVLMIKKGKGFKKGICCQTREG
jgi:DNA mismatch repair ATPase MutL